MEWLKPTPEPTPQSADALIDGFMDCTTALFEAVAVFRRHYPHGRNYPTGRLDADRAEMDRRIKTLCEMADQFSFEADEIGKRVAQ